MSPFCVLQYTPHLITQGAGRWHLRAGAGVGYIAGYDTDTDTDTEFKSSPFESFESFVNPFYHYSMQFNSMKPVM